MVDIEVGSTTYGVILSSAQSSGPSGNKACFFVNDVVRDLNIKAKPQRAANRVSWAVILNEDHYSVKISNAIVVGNTIATLNSYHDLLTAWCEQKTAVYLHIKDSASTYLDFKINGVTYDYLKCRIVGKISDKLVHNKKTISFTVEECAT